MRKKGAKVFAIGPQVDLSYKTTWLGNDAALVANLPAEVADALKGAQHPALILGGGALAVEGVHGAALGLVETLGLIKETGTASMSVHLAAARMGALMLGFATQGGINAVAAAEPKLLFLMGADDCRSPPGSPGASRSMSAIMADKGAHGADVVLPGGCLHREGRHL